jgi:hypothetical protein
MSARGHGQDNAAEMLRQLDAGKRPPAPGQSAPLAITESQPVAVRSLAATQVPQADAQLPRTTAQSAQMLRPAALADSTLTPLTIVVRGLPAPNGELVQVGVTVSPPKPEDNTRIEMSVENIRQVSTKILGPITRY